MKKTVPVQSIPSVWFERACQHSGVQRGVNGNTAAHVRACVLSLSALLPFLLRHQFGFDSISPMTITMPPPPPILCMYISYRWARRNNGATFPRWTGCVTGALIYVKIAIIEWKKKNISVTVILKFYTEVYIHSGSSMKKRKERRKNNLDNCWTQSI